jgi:hypothetical protein
MLLIPFILVGSILLIIVLWELLNGVSLPLQVNDTSELQTLRLTGDQ